MFNETVAGDNGPVLTADMITDAEAAKYRQITEATAAGIANGQLDAADAQDHEADVLRDWYDRLDAVGVCDKNDGWDDDVVREVKAKTFSPIGYGWTKERIADEVNSCGAIGDEDDEWMLKPEDISDAEAQAFVNLEQDALLDLADGWRSGRPDEGEAIKQWVKSLAKSQEGG
jgi:hypothetical protein